VSPALATVWGDPTLSSPSNRRARTPARALLRAGSTAAAVGALTLPIATGSGAQAAPAPSVPDRLVEFPAALRHLSRTTLEHTVGGTGGPPTVGATAGPVDVSVTLSRPPVGAVVPQDAVATGALPPRAVQQARTEAVEAQQAGLAVRAAALGATVTGRATRAGNVVTLRVDADRLDEVAAMPGVVSVKRVARYRTTASPAAVAGSLTEAADHLRVSGLRARGIDGRGVRIAVLDSGIDVTHRNLGGPGTPAAFEECHHGADGKAADRAPVGACAALFGPTAPKVKGGYDFVGETWDGVPAADGGDPLEDPDPNPIDLEGHGTHVADIIAGRSADGTHVGGAPGAQLAEVFPVGGGGQAVKHAGLGQHKAGSGGGILLYGPPGCGKTMLARAVANECNAAFVAVGISDVLNMWLGESERNLAAQFEKARAQQPCVLFFDELDALAYARSKAGSASARTVVNEFLTQLDGIGRENRGVLVLAATNMPWDVDPAMKRPGRFSRQIFVPPPDLARSPPAPRSSRAPTSMASSSSRRRPRSPTASRAAASGRWRCATSRWPSSSRNPRRWTGCAPCATS